MTSIELLINTDYKRMVADKFSQLLQNQHVSLEERPMDLFSKDDLEKMQPTQRIFFSYYSKARDPFPFPNINFNCRCNIELFGIYVFMFGPNQDVKNVVTRNPNLLTLVQPGMFEAIFVDKKEEIRTNRFSKIEFPYDAYPEVAIITSRDGSQLAWEIESLLKKTNSDLIINAVQNIIAANQDHFFEKFF